MHAGNGCEGLRGLACRVLRADEHDFTIKRPGTNAGKTEALWRNESVRASLALGHARGRFLFELRPDIFPHGYLTDTEINLWSKYINSIGKKKKEVNNHGKDGIF